MNNIKCRDCRYYEPTDPPKVVPVHNDGKCTDMEVGLCDDAERRATETAPYAIVNIQATMVVPDFVHDCPTFELKEQANG